MSQQLTAEYMREWEARLGREKVAKAVDYMRANGWQHGDAIPMWCWAEAYRLIESGQPMPIPLARADRRSSNNLLADVFGF